MLDAILIGATALLAVGGATLRWRRVVAPHRGLGTLRAALQMLELRELSPGQRGPTSLRAAGRLDDRKVMVDVVSHADPALLLVIHVPLPDAPGALSLEAPAPQTSMSQAHASQRAPLPEQPALLRLGPHSFEAPLGELMGGLFIDTTLLERLARLSPLWHLSVQAGWLSVGFSLEDESLWGRHGDPTMLSVLIGQAADAMRLSLPPRQAPKLLHDLFWGAPAFGALRQQLLDALLRHYPKSEEAHEVWDALLVRGNLYDVLYLLHMQGPRLLREISEARLLALVNGLHQVGQLDAQALPKLLAQRFDFKIICQPHLRWEIRRELMRLGMMRLPLSASLPVMTRLYPTLDAQQQAQLWEQCEALCWSGTSALVAGLDERGGASAPQRLMWRALASALEAPGTSAPSAREAASLERAALQVLRQRDDEARRDALRALAIVGGADTMRALRERAPSLSWLGARQAKRAAQAIALRLRAQPQRGALTALSHDAPAGGVTLARAGQMELSDGLGPSE